jgi:hypothetical protein
MENEFTTVKISKENLAWLKSMGTPDKVITELRTKPQQQIDKRLVDIEKRLKGLEEVVYARTGF